MLKQLTDRQLEILRMIDKFIIDNHYPPTFREIGAHFEMYAKGAFDHICALERKGAIQYEHGKPRTIRITETGREALNGKNI